MNRHLQSLSLIVLASFIILFTQSGCRENTLIRSKVLPANDTVGVKTYTLSCVTHTYYDNYAITSTDIGGIPIYQGVGVYTDPYFGTMTGATYFQLSYGGTPGNPFTGMVVDSAVLVLPYSGFTFGDTTAASLASITQTYQVFYMLDSLGTPGLVNYYSGSTKPIDVTNPLSDPVAVNLDSFIAQRNTFAANPLLKNTPGLRIELRLPALFKYLTPAMNYIATSTNLPQDFFNTFNGICVMPANTTQGGPAIPYFQLDGTNLYNEAGILVFYHDPTSTVPDTTPYVFNFDPSVCSHFNRITRSYSRYPVNSLINSSLANDSIIVLQNQPGASLDIVIPGILSLPAGVINNAQLQLSLLPGYDTVQLPERLYPVGIGSARYPTGVGQGIPYNLADRYPTTSLTPLSFMDGYYHNNFANGITKYTINIPREVMASIAAGNDTIHIHITGTEDYYGAFKMRAGGGTYHDSAYRPKLFVVYSKLNN